MGLVICSDQGVGDEQVGASLDVMTVWRGASGNDAMGVGVGSTFDLRSRRVDVSLSTGKTCAMTAPDDAAWNDLVTAMKNPEFHRVLTKEIVICSEALADDGGFRLFFGGEMFIKPSNDFRDGSSAYDRAFNAFHDVEMAWYRVEEEALASPTCR